MKAVLLDKPGPPSSLRIGEISIPRPGVDEALVRVCATSLNPVDYKVAAQGYEGWNYPHVLGMATELMALVQDGKIRPTVAEQITLEAIPKALERLAEGMSEAK